MDKFDFRFLVDAMQQIEQSKNVRRLIWAGIFVASLYGFAALFGGLSSLVAALPWERLLP